ncbi:MAG: 50S ribosomal protein L5 [Simkania sp.]|uniref:Large ribosomal subunit protein uL5 n=1 Tax=Simkania negevensis (strain ATCC VR-1471 / DSM 27360 / Z) TaxID=331113 RepID=F8L3W3_SIMNZ|nr:50S ribosomal protein L5 [Simkania negevensis]MCB1067269.1 50S ribosomal protein L5 [Simkania sp.]MCP5489706.1 50S ribosomal protein L5 [Chlamydiales bacterium]MCB1074436.1 50S ribosomal protein L5 [Simkania sp.]MCB1083852.1 50S ribosomal protein L5 [Simkania sp.]CCB89993.1 50S ribosomal protein L5 [Simkania negevensis Z]
MSRLKKKYVEEIREALKEKFSLSNNMCIPMLKKIVISMGVAEALKDKNAMQDSMKELSLISGQKPIMTKAKKSISNFKLREGQTIGLKVTLRGIRMYEFFDRFANIVCPRIRDFRGFEKKGDGRGSYSLGISDQQIFPELNLDEVKREQGMNITFVTSAGNEEQCLELLTQLGLPFKRKQ